MAKIAVLGYGTVGSGVVEVLETNKNSIEKRAGEGIEVKYVLDLRDFPGDPVQEKIVHDVDIIIQDKEMCIRDSSYISVLNFTSTKDPIILSKQTLLNFSEHYCHIISLKIQTEKEIADGGINNLNLNQ